MPVMLPFLSVVVQPLKSEPAAWKDGSRYSFCLSHGSVFVMVVPPPPPPLLPMMASYQSIAVHSGVVSLVNSVTMPGTFSFVS